jgi:Polyketide cyclase / dehydrase and lipid transport
MAVDVTTEIVIDLPRPDVARFAGDPANARVWYANIRSVEWETEPVVAVGSRIAFVARFLGRELRYTYEITELEPDSRFVMRTAQGPFPMETTYEWFDAPAGVTRMTLRNRGEPSGFGRIAALVMAPAMRRANRADLARLKAHLEPPRA